MAIPCPPEVLSPREAFWISLVNRRNQRFLLFDGAAARESRDIIKNPRSPRGKNDIDPALYLIRMAPARKLFESRALNRGGAWRKAQVGKEKKKITATGRRAILREEVSSVERIGIAYPFDNGERIQEPLFSSLFPPRKTRSHARVILFGIGASRFEAVVITLEMMTREERSWINFSLGYKIRAN